MVKERLQKILAHAGYGSRRSCEVMIKDGRVAVDGRLATIGDKADPNTQRITVDGTPIRLPQTHTYIALYKPRGVISTTSDPEGRRTVLDFVQLTQRLYPIGRLDADSEGLILLSDDGELTQRLTHPRYGHPRIYRVLVVGEPDNEALNRWRRGITLDGKKSRFSQVEIESHDRGKTWLRVTVHEGRKHLVRRMVAALGYPARRLIRVGMGPIRLGDLRPGRWRYLSTGELNALRKELGVSISQKRAYGSSSRKGARRSTRKSKYRRKKSSRRSDRSRR